MQGVLRFPRVSRETAVRSFLMMIRLVTRGCCGRASTATRGSARSLVSGIGSGTDAELK